MLIGTNDAFLIDHELTLAAQDIVNIDIDRFQLEDKFTKYHLFYPYLKKTRKKAKQNFFNDFSLYLNNLSINKLTPFFNRIKEEGFTDYSPEICNWMEQIKQNSNTFVNKLKGSLQ